MKFAIVELKYVRGRTIIVPINWIKKFNSKFKPTQSFICYISANIADVPNFDVDYYKTDFNGTTGTFKVFIIKITNSIDDAIIYQREKRMKSVPNKFREPTNTEAEIAAEQNRKRLSEKRTQNCNKRKAMVKNVSYLSDALFKVEDEQAMESSKKELQNQTIMNCTVPCLSDEIDTKGLTEGNYGNIEAMSTETTSDDDIDFHMNIPTTTTSNDLLEELSEPRAKTVSKDLCMYQANPQRMINKLITNTSYGNVETVAVLNQRTCDIDMNIPATPASNDLSDMLSEHQAKTVSKDACMYQAVSHIEANPQRMINKLITNTSYGNVEPVSTETTCDVDIDFHINIPRTTNSNDLLDQLSEHRAKTVSKDLCMYQDIYIADSQNTSTMSLSHPTVIKTVISEIAANPQEMINELITNTTYGNVETLTARNGRTCDIDMNVPATTASNDFLDLFSEHQFKDACIYQENAISEIEVDARLSNRSTDAMTTVAKERLKMSESNKTVIKNVFTKIDKTMQRVTKELNSTSKADLVTTTMTKQTVDSGIQTSTSTLPAHNLVVDNMNLEQQQKTPIIVTLNQSPKARITDLQESIILDQSMNKPKVISSIQLDVELSNTATSYSPCVSQKRLKEPHSGKTKKRQPNDIDRDTYIVSDTRTYLGEPTMDRTLPRNLNNSVCISEKQSQAPAPSQPTFRMFPVNEITSVSNTSINSLEPFHTLDLDFDELMGAIDEDMCLIPDGQNFSQNTGLMNTEIKTFPCPGTFVPKIINTHEIERNDSASTSIDVEQSTSNSNSAFSVMQMPESDTNEHLNTSTNNIDDDSSSLPSLATGNSTANCTLCEKLQLENITLRKQNVDLTERNNALQHALVSITKTIPKVPPVPFEEKDGGRLYGNSVFLNKIQCEILDRIKDPQKYLNNVVLAVFGSETLKNSSVTGAESNNHKTPRKPRLDPIRLKLIYSLMASMTNNSPTFSPSKINQILNKKISNLNAAGKPRKTKKKTNSTN